MTGYYRITVWDNGVIIPALVTIRVDNGDIYSSNPFNHSRQTVEVDFNKTPWHYGADLIITAKGYKTYSTRLRLDFNPHQPDVDLPDVTLERDNLLETVKVQGNQFITESGKRFIWKMNTDFALLLRYINGDDIENIIRERLAVNSRGVRVLGMAYNLFTLNPEHINGYYEYLKGFVKLLANFGMYVEYVAFADLQKYPKFNRFAHWSNIIGTLSNEPNVFVELVNEWQQNGVSPHEYDKPEGIITSQGSNNGDGAYPPKPGWDYHTWHGRRDWKSIFSSCEDLYSLANGKWAGFKIAPAVANEPIKFGDSFERNPFTAYSIGLTSALYGAGCTFHFFNGLGSNNFTDLEALLAKEMFRGLDEVRL